MAAIMHVAQDKSLHFTNVIGYQGTVAANVCPSKKNLTEALNVSEDKLLERISQAQSHPIEAKMAGYDARNWDINTEPDLTKLPILTHYEGDKGPYITIGMVSARFPENREENLSVQRMLPIGRREVVARVVPRHLLEILKRKGGEIDVAVSIGLHPALMLGTSLQPPYGQGEYGIVNALMKGRLKLMECEESKVAVPMEAEIVLEGVLSSKKMVEEGPFVDLTGTYDAVRMQPTIRFTRMHMKKRAIYQALLPAGEEHKLFMGLPQELKIWDYLKRSIPGVRKVHLTSGGARYLHCVVSLDKSTNGDGKTAILNCFAASHALKLVIAVDSDIDPGDWDQVEWALATRFQADRGLVTIHGARGSSLDPSSGKTGLTAKLGLDATLPVDADRSAFMKGRVAKSKLIGKLTGRSG
jgi:4-hydroxy-3-polyprenylbenzoate decarboxylase